MPHNDYWAHSRNDEGRRQPLYEHLNNVARLAEGFASAFDSGEAARLLGWWHDVGKYASRWQEYLLKAEAGLARRGPDHKAAGALWAQEAQSPLGLVVQAHHGGLRSAADWRPWIERMRRDAEAALREAQEAARRQGIPAADGDRGGPVLDLNPPESAGVDYGTGSENASGFPPCRGPVHARGVRLAGHGRRITASHRTGWTRSLA